MAEDLLKILTQFHREVVLPDMERIVDSRITPLREEMLASFDAVLKRLERLEGEYHLLVAAVRSMEERLANLEAAMEKVALRSELVALRDRVDSLQQRIADLESRL
ncbi:MAG: hypothetical protein WA208_02270 [Thermoanaerobaculia bacterium]